MLFPYMKSDPLVVLRGNNSCKMYNLRIKVGNVQKIFKIITLNTFKQFLSFVRHLAILFFFISYIRLWGKLTQQG